MKYYIDSIHYYRQELRAAEKFILPTLEPYVRTLVTQRWVYGLLQYLESRLQDFESARPAAQRISASFAPSETARSGNFVRTRDPLINVGKISLRLIPIHTEHDVFEPPLFPRDSFQE